MGLGILVPTPLYSLQSAFNFTIFYIGNRESSTNLVTFHSNVAVFYSMVAHVRLIVLYMYVEEFLRTLMFIPLYCNLWLQYHS